MLSLKKIVKYAIITLCGNKRSRLRGRECICWQLTVTVFVPLPIALSFSWIETIRNKKATQQFHLPPLVSHVLTTFLFAFGGLHLPYSALLKPGAQSVDLLVSREPRFWSSRANFWLRFFFIYKFPFWMMFFFQPKKTDVLYFYTGGNKFPGAVSFPQPFLPIAFSKSRQTHLYWMCFLRSAWCCDNRTFPRENWSRTRPSSRSYTPVLLHMNTLIVWNQRKH